MEEVEIREKKKGNGIGLFFLCIAFLLIGAGLSYYYLTVYVNKNNNTQDNINTNVKNLNPNGVLVNELISRIDYDNGCGINTDLYKISNINIDNMSDDYKRALVAQEAYGKKIDGNITFTEEEFQKASNILFGSTVHLDDISMTNICPNIIYDSANQVYHQQVGAVCNITCNPFKTIRYIIKAEQTDNNIYIYVAVANFDEVSRKVYNVNDINSVIQGIDGNTFDISVDYEKVNNYKYTYNYDSENNNYIFKSIELVK